ncbi:MmyB family transcriptional regulator [Streptomyces mutabilis]|uniref:MmyB family transcriptional regulator n=1 Tax=Streptomyces mutabilis TaxID=67332 RepID=UPI002E23F30B
MLGTHRRGRRLRSAVRRPVGARHPADRALGKLVNEYAAHDPDFVAGWRSHDVRPRPTLRERLRHPELGELELDRQTLLMPGTSLRLVLYTAETGSLSATVLAQLDAPDTAP